MGGVRHSAVGAGGSRAEGEGEDGGAVAAPWPSAGLQDEGLHQAFWGQEERAQRVSQRKPGGRVQRRNTTYRVTARRPGLHCSPDSGT